MMSEQPSHDRTSKRTTIPIWHRLPNTSFGICLGLAGQSLLWSMLKGGWLFDVGEVAQVVFWAVSLVVTSLFLSLYLLKIMFYYPLVLDELRNPARVHFFNMPHLILMLLGLSAPDCLLDDDDIGRQIIWGVAFVIQVSFTSYIYEDWLFSKVKTINCAQPQFLLSIVGWFLLACFGAVVKITDRWGVAIPDMCFGIGMTFYFMVAISIFNSIHHRPADKGSPALFLLIAAPAIGSVALDLLEDVPHEFATGGLYLLGWSLMMMMLLVRIGPKIAHRPPVLGAYWAYVFPLGSLAMGCVRYASEVQTTGARILALVTIGIAFTALFVVFCRMCWHAIQVALGNAEWTDPLLSGERLVYADAITHTELVEDLESA